MRKLKISAVCLSLVCSMAALNTAADVRICRLASGADVLADNTGTRSVSSAFQRCIDENVPTMLMDLPPGRYLVDVPIQVIRSGRTIRTAGLSGNIKGCQQLGDAACAVFVASIDPAACVNSPDGCGGEIVQNGILQAGRVTINGIPQGPNVKNVIFDHLVIDGQGGARQNTDARRHCNGQKQPETTRYGYNSRMVCDGTTASERCEYTFNYTRNAICGTGLEFAGSFGRVQGNAAFHNGTHDDRLWADGLTVINADGGIVNDNHVVNNTDVGLIVGSCANGTINSNWIQQTNAYAFAGLMIGNFCEGNRAHHNNTTCQNGNYTNTPISHNTIQCDGQWCGFGINVGADPWIAADDDKNNIIGGKITQNSVSGARVLVNFGGAGTNTNPDKVPTHSNLTYTVFQSNTLTNPPAGVVNVDVTLPNCKTQPNVLMNLINNEKSGDCGNFVVADPLAASSICFRNCWTKNP